MNITLRNTDPVNAIISVNVVESDYQSAVEGSLKKFRQRAEIPGFRKGMVPMGMVKKMYGEAILAEEINKLVANKLYSYLTENKLNVLGEPLGNQTEQQKIDFHTQKEFEFLFDIALAPEMNIELSEKDVLPYYTVQISEEMENDLINSYRANYGTYKQVDEFSGKDMLKGTLVELGKNNKKKREGLVVEEAVMMPFYLINEEEKAKFENAKKGDEIVINPSAAYEGYEAEIASFLKIEKDAVKDYTGDFKYTIEEITHYEEAEIDEALFDKVFGQGEVKTEEEFRSRIREVLAQQYEESSSYRFALDVRQLLDKKTEGIQFPEAFLKRWLLASDEKRTKESLEAEFPKILNDLRYHLAKEQVTKDCDITVETDDLLLYAKRVAAAQFAQYGMVNVPEDIKEKHATDMLNNKETRKNIADRVVEEKLMLCIKEKIKTDNKELSKDDFSKLFEQNTEEQ